MKRRYFKQVCGWLGVVCGLGCYIAISAVEQGSVSIVVGGFIAIMCIAMAALTLTLAGVMEWI